MNNPSQSVLYKCKKSISSILLIAILFPSFVSPKIALAAAPQTFNINFTDALNISDSLINTTSVISNPRLNSTDFNNQNQLTDFTTAASFGFVLKNSYTFTADNCPAVDNINICASIVIALNEPLQDFAFLSQEKWNITENELSIDEPSWDYTQVGNVNLSFFDTNNQESQIDTGLQIARVRALNFNEGSEYDSGFESLKIDLTCDFENNPSGCILPAPNGAGALIIVDLLGNAIFNPAPECPDGCTSLSYISGLSFQTVPDFQGTNSNGEVGLTMNTYGNPLTITANVEPRLEFTVEGLPVEQDLGNELSTTATNDSPNLSCNFGTLSPGIPKSCAWQLNISTNAQNGYLILVRQDEDLSNGEAKIDNFPNGQNNVYDQPWISPSFEEYEVGGHLGFTSDKWIVDDTANWNHIPDILGNDIPPSQIFFTEGEPFGLVAEGKDPGDYTHLYAIKVESNSSLPQASASINQSYSHNQFFVVLANF